MRVAWVILMGCFCAWGYACSPTETRCSKVSDCPDGWACLDQICKKPKPAQCTPQTEKQDCDNGMRCQEGICALVGRRCATDAECFNGERCSPNGICTKLFDAGVSPESTAEQRLENPTGSDAEYRPERPDESLTPTDTETDTEGPDVNFCTQDADCLGGEVCNLQNKTCEPKKPTSCTSDNDCKAPSGACYQGQCQSCASQFFCPTGKCDISTGRCVMPPCTADIDCSAPKGACQSGQCASCTTDFACSTGQTCEQATGRCLASSSLCSSDLDCAPPNGSCRSQQCTSCFQKFNCPTGQACIAASGRCENRTTACSSHAQCLPPDGTCLNGACRSCFFHFACSAQERCDASTGRCQASTGTCQQHTDCVANQYCKAGQCATKQCDPSGTPACSMGQICQNFECLPSTANAGCTSNTQCKANEFCQEGRCRVRICDDVTPCAGKMRCEQNTCVPAFSLCVSGLCGGQQRCIQDADGKNHCLVPCATVGTPCSAGGMCTQIEPQDGLPILACLPPSSLASGQSCNPKNLLAQCPDDHACLTTTSSSSFQCYKRCTPGLAAACKSTEECLELSPTKGVCITKGSKGVGDYCYQPSSTCRDDGVCIYSRLYSTSGICYKRCAAPGTVSSCKTGDECVALARTDQFGACVPKNRLNAGQICYGTPLSLCDVGLSCHIAMRETSGVCRKICKSHSDCAATDECSDSLCLAKGTQDEGRSCTPSSNLASSRCKSGLLCIQQGSSSFSATCRRPCQSNGDCASTAGCFNGICQPYTTYSEGTSCSNLCKKDLLCAKSPSYSATCYKMCQNNGDCTNVSYPECYSGFCLKKSTYKEGDFCTDSVSSHCEIPLICTYPPTTSTAYSRQCLRTCSRDTDCTNSTYPKCLTKSGIGSFCFR